MPSTPQLLLSSDEHLDTGAWVRYPELTGDGPCALRQIGDICLERGLDHYSAGDSFDSDAPGPGVLALLLAHAARLRSAGRCYRFIRGDHDSRPDGSYLLAPATPDAEALDGRVVELASGALLCGLDYRKGPVLAAAVRALAEKIGEAEPAILLCHQRWFEFMGSLPRTDGRLADLPFRHVWTGDFHRHETLRFPDGKVVLSPGATHMRDVAEPTQHFVFVIHDDLKAESVPLVSRPFHRAAATSPEELEALLTRAAELSEPGTERFPEIARPLVRVDYAPALPGAARRLRAAFSRCHLMLEPLAAGRLRRRAAGGPTAGSAVTTAEEPPPSGPVGLAALLQQALPAEQAADALRLLEASPREARAVLAEIRQRIEGGCSS